VSKDFKTFAAALLALSCIVGSGPAAARFLSVDPVPANPNNGANFNRYDYTNDNPYKFTDPDGRYVCSGSSAQCTVISSALTKTADAAGKLPAGSTEQKALNKVLKLYGKEGVKNGVSVKFSNDTFANTTMSKSQQVTISFNPTQMHNAFAGRSDGSQESVESAGTVAHEGQHGVDDRARGRMAETTSEVAKTEHNAFTTQSYVNQGEGTPSAYGLWRPGMSDADRADSINQNAAAATALDCAGGGCR
jgi:hypothetical protein